MCASTFSHSLFKVNLGFSTECIMLLLLLDASKMPVKMYVHCYKVPVPSITERHISVFVVGWAETT